MEPVSGNQRRVRAMETFKSAHRAQKSGNLAEARRLFLLASEKFQALAASQEHFLPQMTTFFRSMVEASLSAAKSIEDSLSAPHNDSLPPHEEVKASIRPHVIAPQEPIQVPQPISTHRPDTKFSEIVGLSEAKAFLQSCVEKIRTGVLGQSAERVLIYGPPGSGKTFLAKALLHDTEGVNVFFFNSCDLFGRLTERPEEVLRTVFQAAVQGQPSIVFVDEIDVIATKGEERENDRMERILKELIQGFESIKGERVLILGATSSPWRMDPGLTKCFDHKLYTGLPDETARTKMIHKTLKNTPNSLTNSDIREIAKMTDGYTGADLMLLVRDSQFAPVRRCMAVSAFRINKDNRFVPTSPDDPLGIRGGIQNLPNPERIKVPPVLKEDVLESLSKLRSGVGAEEMKRLLKWDGVREFHG